MNHGEKLGKFTFLERGLEKNPQNYESLYLDQDSRINHQVNKREISKIKNRKKPKLKLTNITIRN